MQHRYEDHAPSAGPGPGLGTVGRLALSSAIFGTSAAVQAVGGALTGSLGLVSDALENLNDLVANLLSLTSLTVANRREPCDRFTYGWHRLEVFNTVLGGGMLLVLALFVVVEALHRFQHPHAIQTGWVLVFSLAGLALNLTAALALRPRDQDELERDANLKAAYLHAFSDSLASLGLVASALVIRFTGWRWVDPLVALAIVAFILKAAFGLLKDATSILMHKAAFDHLEARRLILALPGITGVDDLRSWRMCSHLVVCTAHVQVDVERLADTAPLLASIERTLADAFRVRHVTVHFETAAMAGEHHHLFVHKHEVDEGHAHHDHHDHHGHAHS
jgi:cobalt-zinc-cadmium efflux system protein